MRISDWSSDVCSSDLGAHGDRQLDDLPQVGRRRGEDGQAPHGLAVEATPHEGLDAIDVLVHGSVPVGALSGGSEHRLELVLDILLSNQAPSVDVEVDGRDRCVSSPDPCELPDSGFAYDGHCTSSCCFRITRSVGASTALCWSAFALALRPWSGQVDALDAALAIVVTGLAGAAPGPGI